MGKRLFLIICASLFGAYLSSSVLMATDEVNVVRVNDVKAVETVPLPEPKPEPEIMTRPTSTPVVRTPVAGIEPQIINYTVGIFSNQMVVHDLSYSSLYKTGRLVYGHNSANLLGNLGTLGDGAIFNVTEGGVTTTYRVAFKAMYEKTSDGFLNGDPYLMGTIVDTAMGHRLALMTCAGTTYGNGDASHRLVVYADPV